jgi:hypothetical protein
MEKARTGFVLVATFLAGCLASHVASFVVPPVRAGTSPQRWEYTCIETRREYVAAMNSFGQQGWELTTGIAPTYGDATWCFKRPLP